MAYSAITQNEHEADLLQGPLAPLCHAHDEDLRHENFSSGHVVKQPTALLRSLLGGSTSENYEQLEENDYHSESFSESREINHNGQVTAESNLRHKPHSYTSLPHSSSPKPLVCTASGRPIRLRHPTPDLQFLQGAHTGNIERLEQSAEHLSLSSSDLSTELRKLDLEQKRRSSASSTPQTHGSLVRQLSTSSFSNSIIGVNSTARNGGFSHGAFMNSPRESIMSLTGSRLRSMSGTSRLDEIPEPESDVGDSNIHSTTLENFQIPSASLDAQHELRDDSAEGQPHNPTSESTPSHELPDRPPTPASADTYQQATNLFLDFDGVHCVPHPRNGKTVRQVSLDKPMLARNPKRYEEPPTGENLVYYPAPIPQTLNLPQRLSKRPTKSDQDRRRTQLINTIVASDSKPSDADEGRKNKGMSNVPTQLRASVFFDQPGASLNVQIQNQSAVITLDSILDAAAHAPVSAFTDHPIVGQVGPEVYGKSSKKRPVGDKKRKTRTKSALGLHRQSQPMSELDLSTHPNDHTHENTELEAAEQSAEGTPLRASTYQGYDEDGHYHESERDNGASVAAGEDELDEDGSSGDEYGDENDEEEAEEEPVFVGRPTTLLAELQLRKQEQKQRTRTAATAFPNGMHSTLLELDAVAQTQSKSRRQKHVTLAWEAPPSFDPDAEDDEDVPLGVLFASKNPALDENRPVGLMERREIEDNEPLSRRRARLRGEAPVNVGQNPLRRATTMPHMGPTPSVVPADHESSDEEETLGQRLRRLKEKERPKSIVAADFASEMMVEITSKLGDVPASAEPRAQSMQGQHNDEEEETLGQRKKRLQAERKSEQPAEESNKSKPRNSMASILQSYPVSAAHKSIVDIPSHKPTHYKAVRQSDNHLSAMYTLPPNLTYSTPGFPQYTSPNGMPPSYGPGLPYGNPLHYYSATMAANQYPYGMVYPPPGGLPVAAPPLDTKERDMIDRWRHSVMGS